MKRCIRFRGFLMALGLFLAAVSGCKRSRPEPAPEPAQEVAPRPPAASPAAAARDGAAPPVAGPRLVVLVVVDQLPSWWFGTVTDLLDGGIGRMLREGVYYPDARIPYALTFTATGHAALSTGAPPAVSGILANAWYRRDLGRQLGAVEDPDSPVHTPGSDVVPAGRGAGGGVSGAQLRVPGIADVLEQATGGRSKTVAVSLKDRSAVLVLGRRPDVAVWYAPDQPAMTTSRYYAAAPPAWLRALAKEQPVSRHFDAAWLPLDGVDHAARTRGLDGAPGEGEFYGLGNRFPHELAGLRDRANAVKITPAGDLMVLDAARAAMAGEAMGEDPVPDLLALSFSAQDYAGHVWGQESWERLDIFLRLDDALGALLGELDRRLGRGGYAVVLTSDHGAARMVERARAEDGAARRILNSEIEQAARQAAARVLGAGNWVAAISAATVYMSKGFAALDQERKDAALDAMVRAIADIDGMGYATRTERITGGCEARHGLDALVCRSLIPGESGEIFFAPVPGCPITAFPSGTNHGSPCPDDRVVPILVYAPGSERWAAPRVWDEPVSLLQVASTLAELLGVASPRAAGASPLP